MAGYILYFRKHNDCIYNNEFNDLTSIFKFLEEKQIKYYFIRDKENEYTQQEINEEKYEEKYEGIRPSDNLTLVDIDEYYNLKNENAELKNDLLNIRIDTVKLGELQEEVKGLRERHESHLKLKIERDAYKKDYESCFEDLVKLQKIRREYMDLVSDIVSCFCHDDSLTCKNILNTINKFKMTRK